MSYATREELTSEIQDVLEMWEDATAGGETSALETAGAAMEGTLDEILGWLTGLPAPREVDLDEMHKLADMIYTALDPEIPNWLQTTDGTGNVVSHLLARKLLTDGWVQVAQNENADRLVEPGDPRDADRDALNTDMVCSGCEEPLERAPDGTLIGQAGSNTCPAHEGHGGEGRYLGHWTV